MAFMSQLVLKKTKSWKSKFCHRFFIIVPSYFLDAHHPNRGNQKADSFVTGLWNLMSQTYTGFNDS